MRIPICLSAKGKFLAPARENVKIASLGFRPRSNILTPLNLGAPMRPTCQKALNQRQILSKNDSINRICVLNISDHQSIKRKKQR
jgi:hypothetical protein